MHKLFVGIASAAALVAFSQVTLADGDSAVKGGVGGAVAGAIVGGPVGAAVGGVAGMAVGGAATGPDHPTVIERRAADVPDGCNSKSITNTDSMGNSETRTRTNC
jgi:hypothetical protein